MAYRTHSCSIVHILHSFCAMLVMICWDGKWRVKQLICRLGYASAWAAVFNLVFGFVPIPRSSFLQYLFNSDFSNIIRYHCWLGHGESHLHPGDPKFFSEHRRSRSLVCANYAKSESTAYTFVESGAKQYKNASGSAEYNKANMFLQARFSSPSSTA